MSYKLTVMPAFWSSDFVPAECIYSGRTEEVVLVPISLSCMSDSQTAAMIQGRPSSMLSASTEDNSIEIEVPAVVIEHARATAYAWGWVFWVLPTLSILIGGGWIIGQYLGWWLFAWIVWVLSVVAAGIEFTLFHFGVDRRRTRLDLLRPGGPIEISFPNRLKSTFVRYRDAYKDFMQARGAERREQGRKGRR